MKQNYCNCKDFGALGLNTDNIWFNNFKHFDNCNLHSAIKHWFTGHMEAFNIGQAKSITTEFSKLPAFISQVIVSRI